MGDLLCWSDLCCRPGGDVCEGFLGADTGAVGSPGGHAVTAKEEPGIPRETGTSPVRWELVPKLCTDLPICLEQCFSNILKQLDPLFFFSF